MSDEQLKTFWEAIQCDTTLQQKVQGITDPERLTAIALEAGFVISLEDINKAQAQVSEEDLSDSAGGNCVSLCVVCHQSYGGP